ncbi:MAG: hypothetical protein RIR20_905, partial [Pseudomonadota bacterium]
EIESIEEFVETLPLLSAYFEEKEKTEKKSTKELLISEVANFSDIHRQYCNAIRENDEIEKILNTSAVKSHAIKDPKLNLFKMFAIWHSKLLRDFFVGPEANFTVQESINIEEEAMLPDAQEMDRLIRYQTTLQRQLSSAVGELIAIRKVDASI